MNSIFIKKLFITLIFTLLLRILTFKRNFSIPSINTFNTSNMSFDYSNYRLFLKLNIKYLHDTEYYPKSEHFLRINVSHWPNRSEKIYVLDKITNLTNFFNEIQNGLSYINIYKVYNSFLTSSMTIFSKDSYYIYCPQKYNIIPLVVKYKFDTVIAIGHVGMTIFGHVFIDLLSFLLFLPKEVIEKGHFIFFHEPLKYSYILLSIFNISKNQMHYLEVWKMAFAKEIYTFYPWPHYNAPYFCFLKIRDLLRIKFNLSNNLPTRIGFYTRTSTYRCISNFKDILFLLNKKFNYKIEQIPDYKNLYESAKNFNEFKIFHMGFHGSILGNIYFMQENTTILEIGTSGSTLIIMKITQALNMNHIFYKMIEIDHFSRKNYYLNPNLILNMFEIAFNITK